MSSGGGLLDRVMTIRDAAAGNVERGYPHLPGYAFALKALLRVRTGFSASYASIRIGDPGT